MRNAFPAEKQAKRDQYICGMDEKLQIPRVDLMHDPAEEEKSADTPSDPGRGKDLNGVVAVMQAAFQIDQRQRENSGKCQREKSDVNGKSYQRRVSDGCLECMFQIIFPEFMFAQADF